MSFLLTMGYVAYGYAYENAVYIWQRNWDGFVREAIEDLGSSVNNFIVLYSGTQFEPRLVDKFVKLIEG